jgi:cobalamin biosynthesis Co2+ chelatase CbiK
LISRDALLSEARRLGLRATPQEVLDELQHGRYSATFFPGGNFIGQQEYDDLLQRANLTRTKFEDSVASEILLNKLQALIAR